MNDKTTPEEDAQEKATRYVWLDGVAGYEKVLDFYRREISHEHTVIGARLGWYVAAQAFLMLSVVTGLLLKSTHELAPLIQVLATVVLPTVGLISTALFLPSALVSARTIEKWHEKQKELLASAPKQFEYYYILNREETWHSKSMVASDFTPDLFGFTWFLLLVAQWREPGGGWPVVAIVCLLVGLIMYKCWPCYSRTAVTHAKDNWLQRKTKTWLWRSIRESWLAKRSKDFWLWFEETRHRAWIAVGILGVLDTFLFGFLHDLILSFSSVNPESDSAQAVFTGIGSCNGDFQPTATPINITVSR